VRIEQLEQKTQIFLFLLQNPFFFGTLRRQMKITEEREKHTTFDSFSDKHKKHIVHYVDK